MPNQIPFVDLSDKMTVREAARYADCQTLASGRQLIRSKDRPSLVHRRYGFAVVSRQENITP